MVRGPLRVGLPNQTSKGVLMNMSPTFAHVVVGVATSGAVTGLALQGSVSGNEAVTVITGICGVLLGTSSVTMGAHSATTTTSAAINETANMVIPSVESARPVVPPL